MKTFTGDQFQVFFSGYTCIYDHCFVCVIGAVFFKVFEHLFQGCAVSLVSLIYPWMPDEALLIDHSGEYNLFAICPFLFAFSKFWKFVCRLSTFEIGIGNVKNDQFIIQCEHIGDAAI